MILYCLKSDYTYIFTDCRTQKSLISYSLNIESVDPRGNKMLLGKSTRERLQQEPFSSWFNKIMASTKSIPIRQTS